MTKKRTCRQIPRIVAVVTADFHAAVKIAASLNRETVSGFLIRAALIEIERTEKKRRELTE
jgi:uncharacterized protein (DUF1778 family)